MNKNIGFNRNVKLDWLDAAAVFSTETSDRTEIRQRLDVVLSEDRTGVDAKRKTIDILINIWIKNGEENPSLLKFALDYYKGTVNPSDRLWLHYGLIIVYYGFFRDCAAIIGQLSKHGELITNTKIKKKLISQRGHLGSLERSVERITSSLRDWGLLIDSEKRNAYLAQYRLIETDNLELQAWLLSCSLKANQAHQIPYEDLLRLPELFPFKFTLNIDFLRSHPGFDVYRQGAGLNMVEIK